MNQGKVIGDGERWPLICHQKKKEGARPNLMSALSFSKDVQKMEGGGFRVEEEKEVSQMVVGGEGGREFEDPRSLIKESGRFSRRRRQSNLFGQYSPWATLSSQRLPPANIEPL